MADTGTEDTDLTDEDKIGLVAAIFIVGGSFFFAWSLGVISIGVCVILMLYSSFLDNRKKDLKRLIHATERVETQQEKFIEMLNDATTREHFAKIGKQDGAVGTDGNGGVIRKARKKPVRALF